MPSPVFFIETVMTDFLKTFWQHLVPQHALSNLMHWLTQVEWSPFKNAFIRYFAKLYRINWEEAERKTPEDYLHFNDFFTRALVDTARPIDTDPRTIISPVDGHISQQGRIVGHQLIQAKGFQYTTHALLGGDINLAKQFDHGHFSVIYLSPRDYHRIHMPMTGQLLSMTYIQGKLFAVNPATVRTIPELFARNERVVLTFKTEIGTVALILVGAIFVGSMEVVWTGKITPPYEKTLQYWDYQDTEIVFTKGEEIARFNMGSTIILLTQENSIEDLQLKPEGTDIKMGQVLTYQKKTQ
jgi:phosphatidylserine decarboxylase